MGARALIATTLVLLITGAGAAGIADRQRGGDDEGRVEMLGLRTVVYHVDDLAAAKEWYSEAFGVDPHFDEPYYVGFDVGGYELGLSPAEGERRSGTGGVDAYWGVEDVDAAYRRLIDLGAEPLEEVRDVGGGIRTATVADPFGNPIGLVENPNFGGEGGSGSGGVD